MTDQIISVIWNVVYVGIVLGVGLTVLNYFLPINQIIAFIICLIVRKKKNGPICPNCDEASKRADVFCRECGKKLPKEGSTQ